MANYLEQYQYQQINPANTNVDQIAKTFQIKNAYWEQGAAQVKSAYQQYLGLDLTNEQNRQGLKQYMEGAKEKIKNISQNLDLSIGENVATADNVFDDLVSGKSEFSQNILGDHQLTGFYKEQMASANQSKINDKGKGYNRSNELYMLDGYNSFANDTDPSNWKKHSQEKKGYEAYYDYTSEQKKLLDDCHGNKMTNTSEVGTNSLYFQTTTDNSLTATKLNGCLESGLSDKAKRQMQIEGYVKFGKDYNTLGTAYQGLLNNQAKSLSSQQQEDQSQYTYYKSLKSPSSADVEKMNYYAQRIGSYDDQFRSISDTVDNLKKDGAKYIQDHYEQVAGHVYQQSLTNQFAFAFAHDDKINKLSPNQPRMLEFREDREDARQTEKLSSDYSIAEIKAAQKAGAHYKMGKNGKPVIDFKMTMGDALPVPYIATDATKFTETDFQKNSTAHLNAVLDADLQLASELAQNKEVQDVITSGQSIRLSSGKDLPTRNAEEKQTAIDYFQTHPSEFTTTPYFQQMKARALSEQADKFNGTFGNTLKAYAKNYTTASAFVEADKSTVEAVNSELARTGFNEEAWNKKLNGLKNQALPVPLQVTIKDETGKTSPFTITKNNIDNVTGVSKIGANRYQVNINGKNYEVSGNPHLYALGAYIGAKNEGYKPFIDKRNSLYEQNDYLHNNTTNITTAFKNQGVGTMKTIREIMGMDETGKSLKFALTTAYTKNQGDLTMVANIIDEKNFKDSDREGLQKQFTDAGIRATVEKPDRTGQVKIIVKEGIPDDIVTQKRLTDPLNLNEAIFNNKAKLPTSIQAEVGSVIHDQSYTGSNGHHYFTRMVKTANGFIYKIGMIKDGRKELTPNTNYNTAAQAMADIRVRAGDSDDEETSSIDAMNYLPKGTKVTYNAAAEDNTAGN